MNDDILFEIIFRLSTKDLDSFCNTDRHIAYVCHNMKPQLVERDVRFYIKNGIIQYDVDIPSKTLQHLITKLKLRPESLLQNKYIITSTPQLKIYTTILKKKVLKIIDRYNSYILPVSYIFDTDEQINLFIKLLYDLII